MFRCSTRRLPICKHTRPYCLLSIFYLWNRFLSVKAFELTKQLPLVLQWEEKLLNVLKTFMRSCWMERRSSWYYKSQIGNSICSHAIKEFHIFILLLHQQRLEFNCMPSGSSRTRAWRFGIWYMIFRFLFQHFNRVVLPSLRTQFFYTWLLFFHIS